MILKLSYYGIVTGEVTIGDHHHGRMMHDDWY